MDEDARGGLGGEAGKPAAGLLKATARNGRRNQITAFDQLDVTPTAAQTPGNSMALCAECYHVLSASNGASFKAQSQCKDLSKPQAKFSA